MDTRKTARVMLASAAFVATALALPASARAHSTTFAMYSKYEATTSGRDIAFVFALDRVAVSQLLEREAAHTHVDLRAIESYRGYFSQYLFQRFFVSNDGVACSHPDQLGRFFWDEPTGRVLAVTSYRCAADLQQLTIRSLVTHDMPSSHELVGDLQYQRALVRSFFSGDDIEAQIALASLPQAAEADSAAGRRPRGRFSYVALPDRERRYTALAQAELGVELRADRAVDVRPLATLWHFIGQGILHIFTGYDHILFILTLLLAVGTWRRLAVIVTSFTAAHSITLAMATLGLVTIPARVIEPLIALSVLLVAADALLRPRGQRTRDRDLRLRAHPRLWPQQRAARSRAVRSRAGAGTARLQCRRGGRPAPDRGRHVPAHPSPAPAAGTYEQARRLFCGSVAVVAVLWIVVRVGAVP